MVIDLPPLSERLTPEPDRPCSLLLIGRQCLSKHQCVMLRRAGHALVRMEEAEYGLAVASALRFDFALIDADDIGVAEAAHAGEALRRRGVPGILLLRGADDRFPRNSRAAPYQILDKPVSVTRLYALFRHRAAGAYGSSPATAS